jgi:hypothetical protein
MKKAFFFAGLAAAALTFVGCNKEADYAGNGRKVEIVLSDVATRTINYGMSTEWNDGDELSVFNAATGTTSWSSNIKFTVQDASANRAAGEVELTANAYDWYAFYPYTSKIPNPTTLNPEGSTYERSGYTTVGGQFQTQKTDDNTEHLAGVKVPVFGNVKNVPAGETPVIEMKNAASVVRFKVVNAQEEAIKVLSVKFTAPEDIVGTYYIDFSGTAPTFVGSGDNYVFDNVMVTNADPSSVAPDSNADLYAVIKPFTAAAGAKLKVEVEAENADGTKKGTATKEITLTSATEFKSGYIKLLNIPFDVTMTNVTAEKLPYEQSFGEGAGDFTIDNVIGSGIWTPGSNSGNSFMKGTSYLSGKNTEGESWLVSPEIDATTASNGVKLSFQHCINKFFGDVTQEATLWAREKGGEWKQFTISYPTPNGTWSAFAEQVVDLSEYKGKTFQFAFKYVGHSTSAGTWEVMDVHVTDAVVTPEFNAELPGADESLSLTVPASTSSVTINVTGNVAWTASASDGATAAPEAGEGAGTVTVSFPANTDPAPKEYSVTVSTDDAAIIAAGGDEFVFTITQEAVSTEAKSYPYEEKFDKGQGDFTIDNVTLSEGLTYVWKHDATNKYMKASAYVSGTNKASESWLISPLVDLSAAVNPALTFTHAMNYFSTIDKAKEEATVWVRIEGGAWTALEGVTYPASLSWTFVDCAPIDLSAYKGKKVQIGFKYTSTADKAGTWEIKNFKLDEAASGPVDPTFTVPATLTVEEGKTAQISVTTNTDGAITYTSASTAVATVAADGTVTGVAAGTTTITVAAAATTAFNAASATVAVTVTEAQTGTFYGKVRTLTSGKKYLIVGGDHSRAMVPPTNTAAGRVASEAVTITDGKIVADATTNAYAVTITKSGDDVSIVLPNSNYLVYSGSGTGVKGSTTASDFWKVTSGEHGTFRFLIKSVDDRALAFRAGENNVFGAYVLSNIVGEEYFDIDLYELGAEPAAPAVLSSIAVSGQKKAFYVGDTFVFGGIATATYDDGSTKNVTNSTGLTITPPDLTTTGTKTVNVSYTESGNTVQTSYTVTVAEAPAGTSLEFMFNEKSSTTGTDQWPSSAQTAASQQTYTLNQTDYTFALGKDTYMGVYSNAPYLMVKEKSYLGLPAIAGKKLVKVTVTTSSNASTSAKALISSDTAGTKVLSGGEVQALSQRDTEFSWTLSGTAANTVYYIYSSNKNCQYVKVVATYE